MTTMQKAWITNATVHAVMPASDISRAYRFYHDKLGFETEMDESTRQLTIHAGEGCWMLVYETDSARGEATTAAFTVDNLDAVMKDMREHGISFEEYDVPGLKTENGVVHMGDDRSAWFRDSEGNTIAIVQSG